MTSYVRRTCVHYTAPGTRCHAGIDVDAKRDADGRVPCVEIRGITGTRSCDRLSMPAPASQHTVGSLTKALDSITSGRCPKCDDPVRSEFEIDGIIYAMPCRHVIRSTRQQR